MNAIENSINFRFVLNKLFEFWEKFGCVLVQPCQTEISSAVFHPNSFFGIIGNTDCNIMYSQPQVSIQSKNIKYNTQNNGFLGLEVLLKNSIDMPQKIFLDSLFYLGFNLTNTNVLFANDYFENFVFRMTANGYIVYFNDVYIAKMYYIQSISCYNLNSVPLYISYNLDKIIMLLRKQKKKHESSNVDEVLHNDITLKINSNIYDFISNNAINELIFTEFQNYRDIALKLLDNNVIISAYIFILKAKYCLDILNFKNYITSNNKINYNTVLRDLVDKCCREYIENKQIVD